MRGIWIGLCILLSSCGGGGPAEFGAALVGAPIGTGISPLSAENARPLISASPQRASLLSPQNAPLLSPQSAPLLSADALFDWAEKFYPQFFNGGAQAGVFAPYQFRFYPSAGNYLAVANGGVYVLGPVSGGSILKVGELADFTCAVLPCTNALPVQRSSYDNKIAAGIALGPQVMPAGSNNAYAFADFFQDGSYSLVSHSLIYAKTRDPSLLGSISFYRMEAGQWVDRTSQLLADSSGCLHARKAVVADFNGDRKPDIFFACHGYDFPGGMLGEHQRVLLSQPDGKYKNVVVPVTCFCHGASAVDFRGDGYADIVVTDNLIRYTPFFLKNQKNGTFAVDTTRLMGNPATGLDPESLFTKSIFTAEFIDFTNSGRYDLFLAGNEPGSNGAATRFEFVPQILTNDGNNSFIGTEKRKLPVNATYGIALDIVFIDGKIYLSRSGLKQPDRYYREAVVEEVDYATLSSRITYYHSGVFPAQVSMLQWINWLISYQGRPAPMDRSFAPI